MQKMQLGLPDNNNNNTAETLTRQNPSLPHSSVSRLFTSQMGSMIQTLALIILYAVESLSFLEIAFVMSRKWFGYNARRKFEAVAPATQFPALLLANQA